MRSGRRSSLLSGRLRSRALQGNHKRAGIGRGSLSLQMGKPSGAGYAPSGTGIAAKHAQNRMATLTPIVRGCAGMMYGCVSTGVGDPLKNVGAVCEKRESCARRSNALVR
jgi:hypothetical protein